MKRIIRVVAVLLLTLSVLTACSKEEPECEHDYTEEVKSEATYGEEGSVKLTCDKCGDIQWKSIPAVPDVVKVEVLSKDKYTEEQPPMEMPNGTSIPMMDITKVVFEIRITNLTDEPINTLSGTLEITKGDYTMDLFCTFDETIPANDSIVLDDYGFEVGGMGAPDFTEMVIRDAKYEDCTFKFKTSSFE